MGAVTAKEIYKKDVKAAAPRIGTVGAAQEDIKN